MSELRLPAIEFRQGSRTLYSFAVDGKLLSGFAAVSRLKRAETSELSGYQRPEVLSHVAGIRTYVETTNAMIPNAIVVAFDNRVKFHAVKGSGSSSAYSRMGTIVIPLDETLEESQKPGWIVDGQQRAAALRDAQVECFPVSVTAFLANNAQEQREQFILVNSTKPLPKGLIYELLPATEAKLPPHLQRRRFSATLLERLNLDPDSPLRGKINTPTTPNGVIKDNSILKMIENSLTEGVLNRFRDPATGAGDVDAMLDVIKAFWAAASIVFREAWNLKPKQSRLIHGAGIVGMGFVMDLISDRYRADGVEIPSTAQFRADLEILKPICRWTTGYWDFPDGRLKWNEVQNTSKHIDDLSKFLRVQYNVLVRDRKPGKRKKVSCLN